MVAGFDRRAEKTEKARMTTYQETNVKTAATQEDMKVRYTAKTHASG